MKYTLTLIAQALTAKQFRTQGRYIRLETTNEQSSAIYVQVGAPTAPLIELGFGGVIDCEKPYNNIYITKASATQTATITTSDEPLYERREEVRKYRRVLDNKTAVAGTSSHSYTMLKRGKLTNFLLTLTTDATVLNRIPEVKFLNGTTVIGGAVCSSTIPASNTGYYYGGLGQANVAPTSPGLRAQISLPDIILEAGDIVRFLIINGQGGDAFTVDLQILYEE